MSFPFGIAAGLLGGVLGGESPSPSLSPQQEWAFRYLRKLAKGYMRDSQSVPLSLPQEQLALAQARGLAGEDFRNQYQSLLATLGTNGPTSESAGDALVRFSEGQQGNLMALNQQALFQALQQRQAWRAQAGQVAGQAGGIAGSPAGGMQGGGMDLSGLFQALGMQLGQRSAASSSYRPPINSVVGSAVGGAAGMAPGGMQAGYSREGYPNYYG